MKKKKKKDGMLTKASVLTNKSTGVSITTYSTGGMNEQVSWAGESAEVLGQASLELTVV